jgi:tetratricopeptide (TPR) repeat protein
MKRTLTLSGALLIASLGAGLAPAVVTTANAAVTNMATSSELPSEIKKLYDTGHYREAVEALETAIAGNQQDPRLQYWLGRCFYELRDYGRAVSSFEHATALDPNHSEYHDWLGRACGRNAEETNFFSTFSSLALARRTNHEFATAVRLDSGNLEAQRDYIRYLLNAPGIVGGSEDHALEQIQELTKVDEVEGDLARGEMLATRKKFDEATQTYEQVLALKSNRVAVYLEIAGYFCDRGDSTHVDQAAEGAAQVAPGDPRIPYYRGVALVLSRRDPARAESQLRNYLANVPDSVDAPSHAVAHEWLAKLYEQQGKLDQAVGEYQAALALDPKNKSLRESLKRLQKQ